MLPRLRGIHCILARNLSISLGRDSLPRSSIRLRTKGGAQWQALASQWPASPIRAYSEAKLQEQDDDDELVPERTTEDVLETPQEAELEETSIEALDEDLQGADTKGQEKARIEHSAPQFQADIDQTSLSKHSTPIAEQDLNEDASLRGLDSETDPSEEPAPVADEIDRISDVSEDQLGSQTGQEGAQQASPAFEIASRASPPLLLTFDAFGTLYTPNEPIAKQYCDVAKRFGYDFEEEQLQESFKTAFKILSANAPNYGKETYKSANKWWQHLIINTLTPLLPSGEKVARELKNALYDQFATSAGYRMHPDVPEFLKLVRSSFQASVWAPKRTMLGIISNSDPRIRLILNTFQTPIKPSMYPPRLGPSYRRNPLHRPATFAFATLSYDCGIEKPDQGIYDAALGDAQTVLDNMEAVKRLTRSSKDLLSNVMTEFHHMHVGDDVDKDVIPALDRGWDAVLLDRSAEESIRERTLDDGRQFPVISSLLALPRLVKPERISDMMAARVASLPEQDHVRSPSEIFQENIADSPSTSQSAAPIRLSARDDARRRRSSRHRVEGTDDD